MFDIIHLNRTVVPNILFDRLVFLQGDDYMNKVCGSNLSKRRYINRRRRQMIFRRTAMIAAIIISTITLIGASRIITHAESSNEPHYYKYYTSVIVMPGDTLPSIAEAYGDNYDSLEAHVSEIMFSNHLSDPVVYPGTSLIVPYYSSEFVN